MACPSSKRKVDTTSAGTPGDASNSRPTAPDAAVLGTYECHWQQEGNEFTEDCEISSSGESSRFSLVMKQGELTGEATMASFGFHFVGALKRSANGSETPIEADFFTQGPGAYATVLQLSDGSLIKLSLQKP